MVILNKGILARKMDFLVILVKKFNFRIISIIMVMAFVKASNFVTIFIIILKVIVT